MNLEVADTCAGALMTIDQSLLQRHLTFILASNAGIRNEALRHYLALADLMNPFGWSEWIDSD